jgi:putative resolvase
VAQKPDLAHQIKALEAYCQQQAITVDEWLSDFGSGLNDKRKQCLPQGSTVSGHTRK